MMVRRASRFHGGVSSFGRLLCAAAMAIGILSAQVPAVSVAQDQVTLPVIPPPAAVTLNPRTTALLMLDFFSPLCDAPGPCQDSLAPMAAMLNRAREAGVLVIFTMPDRPGVSIEAAVAPRPDELVIAKPRLETGFDLMQDTLQAKGISTLIVTGVSAPLAMYTTWEAAGYGYTMVELEDGIPGSPV